MYDLVRWRHAANKKRNELRNITCGIDTVQLILFFSTFEVLLCLCIYLNASKVQTNDEEVLSLKPNPYENTTT